MAREFKFGGSHPHAAATRTKAANNDKNNNLNIKSDEIKRYKKGDCHPTTASVLLRCLYVFLCSISQILFCCCRIIWEEEPIPRLPLHFTRLLLKLRNSRHTDMMDAGPLTVLMVCCEKAGN